MYDLGTEGGRAKKVLKMDPGAQLNSISVLCSFLETVRFNLGSCREVVKLCLASCFVLVRTT